VATDYGLHTKPIKEKRAFEEVSSKLKELIFTGKLKPGQRLPSESALAQHFQVGRQTIREALRILELSGFISVKAGTKGGPIIEGTMLSKMSGLLLDAFRFDRVSLQDLMTARRAIEISVLDAVFKNGHKSGLTELRAIIAQARATREQDSH
jgi:GntR family transcriptional repressor for pyruvate dehydrogenase complex